MTLIQKAVKNYEEELNRKSRDIGKRLKFQLEKIFRAPISNGSIQGEEVVIDNVRFYFAKSRIGQTEEINAHVGCGKHQKSQLSTSIPIRSERDVAKLMEQLDKKRYCIYCKESI